MAPLLEVDGFVLRDVRGFAVQLPALRLEPGRTAALFGPSGSGKSSVLASLFGLLDRQGWTSAGRVRFRGAELADRSDDDLRAIRRRELAFLLQDAPAALDPLVSVGSQIEAATGATAEQAHAALARLGVHDAVAVCARHPHAISGGQAQRAMLAVAFLRRPALIVADEPSASLDGGSYAELVSQLRALLDGGAALLLATHDERLLRDLDADVHVHRDGAFVRGVAPSPPWPPRPPAPTSDDVVLRASGLGLSLGGRRVLDGVGFELRRGEVVALLGESGAGKTSLLRVLAGHRSPDEGRVVRAGRRPAVQLVCQDAFASLTPGRRLGSLLQEAAAPSFDAAAGTARLGLSAGVLGKVAAELSGGERRRAALLRALAVRPDALLLDEPTASLDRTAAVAVVGDLLAIRERRALALLFATHDESLAAAIAHRRLHLRGGTLCED